VTNEPARVDASAGVGEQGLRCEPGWFARVYAEAHRAVVRIESAGGMGAGFLFHSPRHVATAYHVVAIPRPIRVKLWSGRYVDARVVATQPKEDLAVLELAAPATGLEPLQSATTDPVELGTPVVAIGHPFADLVGEREQGLLNWSVSQGIVSGAGKHLLQTDAAVNPGNSGGPVLGCDGRVLGVVSAKLMAEGIGFAIPVKPLEKLVGEIGKGEPEIAVVQSMLGLAFAVQYNVEQALLGFELGLGMAFYDRWLVMLSVGQAWASEAEPPESAIIDRNVTQTLLAGELSYRWLLSEGMPAAYLGVGLGGAAGHSVMTDKLVSAQLSPSGCASGDCRVEVMIDEREQTEWRGYPMVSIHSNTAGAFDVSYSFLPDVTEFRRSYHRLRFGVLF